MQQSLISNDEFNSVRREQRIQLEQPNSEFQTKFLQYLNDFPSENLANLSKQLNSYLSLFAELTDIPYDFVYKTNFASVIFSLYLNNELDYSFRYMLTFLITFLISPSVSEANILSFFLSPDFHQRLATNLFLINSEDFDDHRYKQHLSLLISQSIVLSKKIFEHIPSSHEIIFSSEIDKICSTDLLSSGDFDILCLTLYFLTQLIPSIEDSEELVFISQKLGEILNENTLTKNFRLVTHLIHCIYILISLDSTFRQFFISENICMRITELIYHIKDTSRFCFWNCIIDSFKILSLISNNGTDEEVANLIESNVLVSLFSYKHSFLEISCFNGYNNINQVDYFIPLCDFLSGMIMRNDTTINSFIIESHIIEQCCKVLEGGEVMRKMTIMKIINAAVLIKNEDMMKIFLDCNSLPIVFELMTSMDESFLKFMISLLQNLIQIANNFKDYIAETNFQECYSMIMETTENSEIIDLLAMLYSSIFDDN